MKARAPLSFPVCFHVCLTVCLSVCVCDKPIQLHLVLFRFVVSTDLNNLNAYLKLVSRTLKNVCSCSLCIAAYWIFLMILYFMRNKLMFMFIDCVCLSTFLSVAH